MKNMVRLLIVMNIVVLLMLSCIFSNDESSDESKNQSKMTVSGSVSDSTGTGISGVQVSLISSSDTLFTTTGSSGQYSFSDVSQGSYQVVPSLENHTFTPSSRTITVADEAVAVESFLSAPDRETDSQPLIIGVIHDNRGEPLADVTLTISETAVQSSTDKEGSFAFRHIESGSYTIVPALAGYTFYPPYTGITLESDTLRIDFVGVPQGGSGVTVSGSIVDTEGIGISGIECSLTSAQDRFVAVTDNDGVYRFYGIPPATYGLLAVSGGYTYVPEYLTVGVNAADVTCDTITAIPAGCNCSFNVFGMIKDQDGTGIADVTVMLDPAGINVATDKEGSYYFADIVPGSYTLTPSLQGYAFSPLSARVSVIAGDIRTDFTGIVRTEGFLVTGRIVNTGGYPVQGLEISCTGQSGRKTDTTGSNGYYQFTEMSSGTYQLLPITLPDTTFVPEFQTVTVQDHDVAVDDFVVTESYAGSRRIIGRVVNASGDGLADITVVLIPSYEQAVTDKEGGYVFDGLDDGIYLVSAVKEGWQFAPQLLTITIEGAEVVAQNIVGSQGAAGTYAVYGTVVASNGEVLADVEVGLSPGGKSSVTDKEGNYYFSSVSPGEYTVTPVMNSVAFAPPSFTFTVEDQPVFVPPFVGNTEGGGGGGGGGNGARVYGRVTKADGSGVADVLIQIAGGEVELSMNTGDEGNYAFDGIPDGEYVLVPVPSMQQAYSPPVMIITVAGADVEVNFSVQGSGDDQLHTITVRITDTEGAPIREVLVTLGGGPAAEEKVTGETGTCTFSGLESDSYTITPLKTGWTFNPPTQFAVVTDADMTTEFTGSQESEMAYSITGRVLSETGSGVSGVRIMVNSVELGIPAGSAATLPDGKFVVNDLFPGEFNVIPSKEGYSITPALQTATIENASVTIDDFIAERTDIPEEATVSTLVTMSGATLSVQNHLGDIIDLEFQPRSVLQPVTVTLTTLAEPQTIPLSISTFPGIRIEPDGLLLNRPAKLTVLLAEPPEDNEKNTLFWSVRDDYVLPVADQEYSSDTIQGTIYHFSEYGAGIGTREEVSAQIQLAALAGIPPDKVAMPASARHTWQGSYTQVKALLHWGQMAMTLGDNSAADKAADEAKKASEKTIDDFLDEVIPPADPCDDYFESLDKLLALATRLGAEGSTSYNRGVERWKQLYDQCKVRMILEIDYRQVMSEDDYNDDVRYQGNVTFYAPYFSLEDGEDFGKLEGGGTCLLQGTGSSEDCTWTKAGTVNIDLNGQITLDDTGIAYLELTLVEEYEYTKTTICPDKTWTQDIGFSSEPFTITMKAEKDHTINESKTISGTTMSIRYTLRIPD